jgi:hypothetical protein
MLGLAVFGNYPPEGNQRGNIPQAGLPPKHAHEKPPAQLPTHGRIRQAIPLTMEDAKFATVFA